MNDDARLKRQPWYNQYIKLLNDLNTWKPKTKKEVEEYCGVKLAVIASGAFRETYKVKNLPFVIKFPKTTNLGDKDHTRAEIKAIRMINRLKKFRILKDYMPFMPYCDLKNGVIMLEYCRPYGTGKNHCTGIAISRLIETVVNLTWCKDNRDVTDYASKWGMPYEADVHEYNVAMDSDGYPVLIDLGFFLPLGKGGS